MIIHVMMKRQRKNEFKHTTTIFAKIDINLPEDKGKET